MIIHEHILYLRCQNLVVQPIFPKFGSSLGNSKIGSKIGLSGSEKNQLSLIKREFWFGLLGFLLIQ